MPDPRLYLSPDAGDAAGGTPADPAHAALSERALSDLALLDRFLAGELPRAEADALAARLATDPALAALLREQQALTAALRAQFAPPPAPALPTEAAPQPAPPTPTGPSPTPSPAPTPHSAPHSAPLPRGAGSLLSTLAHVAGPIAARLAGVRAVLALGAVALTAGVIIAIRAASGPAAPAVPATLDAAYAAFASGDLPAAGETQPEALADLVSTKIGRPVRITPDPAVRFVGVGSVRQGTPMGVLLYARVQDRPAVLHVDLAPTFPAGVPPSPSIAPAPTTTRDGDAFVHVTERDGLRFTERSALDTPVLTNAITAR